MTRSRPNDLRSGGIDFSSTEEVEAFKRQLKTRTGTSKLVLHMAPPCATFSRARDRSAATKVRSWDQPAGIQPISDEVSYANEVAANALRLACWAAEELDAYVTIENPKASYLWQYWDLLGLGSQYEDVHLSMCRYGAVYKKDTKLKGA